MGCGTVQVCTAAMHYGYRIVEDMIDGLSEWMDSEGICNHRRFSRKSLPKVTEWKHLNLNYKIVAQIDEALCIGCQLCHIACWDGAHQCIHTDRVSGPVDGHVEVHAKPRLTGAGEDRGDADSEARSAERSTSGRMQPRWSGFRASMRPSAWAATCARWSAR
jgi:NAD-dependent dihydropyrimidine dehydrogenase PreA subunit